VFGESEVRYLDGLDRDSLLNVLAAAFTHDIPCVLITGGWNPPPQLLAACERYHVPLLRTSVATPAAIAKIGVLLENVLAVRQVVHGVLMDILSLGVLITGDSGIGKSECALDLVVRGHRLVADDAVEVRRRGETDLIGACPELTRHHMEVRGLGVINIRDLFGVAATRMSKRMELVVQLERWDTAREYDRLGLEENVWELFGVKIPLVHMPVAPGRNLAILVEVAARNQLLRTRGLNAARDLAARLDQQLREAAAGDVGADEDAEHGGPV
jgi:HPr kinase/phosphorylase